MKIEEVLKEKKARVVKQALATASLYYFDAWMKSVEEVDLTELKEKLRQIKEFSLDHLGELKEKAVNSLSRNGICVHEARDAREAKRILRELIPRGEKVVKSKSNTIRELGIVEGLRRRNEVIETDLGDFIVELCGEEPIHSIVPGIHISLQRMKEKIFEKFGKKLGSVEEVIQFLREHIRRAIFTANVALTGANAIAADGSIFIVENEGNISLLSRIPKIHIIVAGIEKLVADSQSALRICQALALWGTGAASSYINIISSPSKTADLGTLIYGAQGAREVHLILVDNGRTELIQKGYKEALYCINCGACLYFCPVYRELTTHFGGQILGPQGVIRRAARDLKKNFRDLFLCTNCGACEKICPVGIAIPHLVKMLRGKANSQKLEMEANRKMIQNLRKSGNPFSSAREKIKEIYCC
ncbi:MAG: LUD domain-containing protein [Candidatus Nanoarchaeia archaeon]|nr:LUD domain-containing protein [Candidatus Haiyanarchaeum thermophilum]MCW1303307.1 LUD domain-containing protein [Candidatus Haiyanarchaeum thermophilum]MCW1303961.1 LUD domain-containing protein [Candidatus Haiyanarchaeum thermophilum]MCW1306466.1 LUD domain-containing protein [Candidatus Haiyanarchaeum thermophilum]MCW1307236.1 LUD domain-containing protein [Candidatus Haiyanarchaeum thermophilum]